MDQKRGRPRKPDTPHALTVALSIKKGSARYVPSVITPCPEFSDEQREVWDRVMSAVPRDHFTAADQDQMHSYCRMVALATQMERKMCDPDAVMVKSEETLLGRLQTKIAQLTISLALQPRDRSKMATMPHPGWDSNDRAPYPEEPEAAILDFMPKV